MYVGHICPTYKTLRMTTIGEDLCIPPSHPQYFLRGLPRLVQGLDVLRGVPGERIVETLDEARETAKSILGV